MLAVGHEPLFSALAAYLLGVNVNVDFKKGAMMCLETVDSKSAAPRRSEVVSDCPARVTVLSVYLPRPCSAVSRLTILLKLLFAPRRLVLVEQSETALVEFPEPLIPVNVLQTLLAAVTWEVQSQHAKIAFRPRAANAGRFRASFFRPAPDLSVIRREL